MNLSIIRQDNIFKFYLMKKPFSYSIANAPLGSHQYELHIRHGPDNPYSQRLFAHIKEKVPLIYVYLLVNVVLTI